MIFSNKITKYLLFFLLISFSLTAAPGRKNIPSKKVDIEDGKFPIHMPDYSGVDQLLLLSNRWLIVVTNNANEIVQEIDKITDGEYLTYAQAWENSKDTARPDWYAKKRVETLYLKHGADARVNASEFEMDKTTYYAISSDSDTNYKAVKSPNRTTRFITSNGDAKIPGEFLLRFSHYSYLEMPTPLKNGHYYRVSLQNGKSVTFLYDEMQTVSRAIKVNQVGYLPDCKKKFAYLGCHLHEFGPMDFSHAKEFYVVNAKNGRVALQGNLVLRAENPRVAPKPNSGEDPMSKPYITGENTYEIDLSNLKLEGDFFISIPGVGRSWTFKHEKDAYGEAFYTSARGLYHQRCGIAIEEPYSFWPRQKCHFSPVYESEAIPFTSEMPNVAGYNRFDVIGYTMDKTKSTLDVTGGWHDAADWDRNIGHYTAILDLLNAYEIFPDKFYDNQLNIPESGNGIPDILDEAEYGLKVWKKSMDNRGAVAGLVETSTHPSIDDPNFDYAYSRKTRWSTLLYAATAAQFSYLVKPFNEQLSFQYLESAIKAYNFGKDPNNSLGKITIHAATRRGTGDPYEIEWEEKDEYSIPYEIQAALSLYKLTDDESFLNDVPNLLKVAPKPIVWRFSMRDYSPWIYFQLFCEKIRNKLSPMVIKEWEQHYISQADNLLVHSNDQPYRQTWPIYQNYWMSWGSTNMANQARVLFIAYILSGDQKYREAAILNMDFMLGVNPMGMSWTTGLGEVYPTEIQHGVSEDDNIADPVPGITLYGITEGTFYHLKNYAWQMPRENNEPLKFIKDENRNIPIFRNWSCHPHLNTPQCEFTIHETNSATVFATAMLLNGNWKPTGKVKNKKPRNESFLFGHWFLP